MSQLPDEIERACDVANPFMGPLAAREFARALLAHVEERYCSKEWATAISLRTTEPSPHALEPPLVRLRYPHLESCPICEGHAGRISQQWGCMLCGTSGPSIDGDAYHWNALARAARGAKT